MEQVFDHVPHPHCAQRCPFKDWLVDASSITPGSIFPFAVATPFVKRTRHVADALVGSELIWSIRKSTHAIRFGSLTCRHTQSRRSTAACLCSLVAGPASPSPTDHAVSVLRLLHPAPPIDERWVPCAASADVVPELVRMSLG